MDRSLSRCSLHRLALLAVVAATGCAEATGPTSVAPGVPFTLAPGELALVEPGAAEIGFVGVAADSRCPTDVTCVTAGDAAVEVWVREPPGARVQQTLHTDPALGDSVEVSGRELRLLALQPQPRTDRPVATDDYRVTLEVR